MKKIVLLLFMLATFLASLGLADDAINTAVLNSTQTLITNLTDLVFTSIFAIIAYYVKDFLQTNAFCKKYNLDNEKTERLLFNAVSYAEAKSKHYVNQEVSKRQLAISYLERVDPDTINKYGEVLHDMLDRKVEQAKAKQLLRVKNNTLTPEVNEVIINTEELPKP